MSDSKVNTLSGSAKQNPYVDEEGEVSAVGYSGYLNLPAVVTGDAGDVVNGVGVVIQSRDTLTASGSKIASFRHGGVEKAYVGNLGEWHGYGAWDDILGDASQGIATAALDYEAYRGTTGYKGYFFRSGQADELNWRFQFSHRWDPTTSVKFHLHIVPMVNPASTEVFAVDYKYAWATFGEDLPAFGSWTGTTATYNVTTSSAFKHSIMPIFTSEPPAAAHESAFLLIWLARNTTGTDTYTTGKATGTSGSNVMLLGADVHYQATKLGTNTTPGA